MARPKKQQETFHIRTTLTLTAGEDDDLIQLLVGKGRVAQLIKSLMRSGAQGNTPEVEFMNASAALYEAMDDFLL